MKNSSQIELIVQRLSEAFDLQRNTSIRTTEKLKLIFVFLFYKRFSDFQTNARTGARIIIPEINNWRFLTVNGQEHIFSVVDSNIRDICSKNKIKNLTRILDIKKYDTMIGQQEQSDLFEIFSSLDLSLGALSDNDLTKVIEAFFDKISSSNQDISACTTPSSLNKLVVKLLNPQDHEYFYATSFGLGTIFLALMQQLGTKNYQSTIKSSSLKVGGCERNQDMWTVAVLIALLFNIKIDRLENENYFSPGMNKILSGEYLQNRPPKKELTLEANKESIALSKKATWKEIKTLLKQADEETLLFLNNAAKAMLLETDVLFLNPPFSLRLSKDVSSRIIFEGHTFEVSQSNAALLYVVLCLKQLRKEGRMAALLPLSSLAREGDARKIWQFFCENDYLEAIIQLPERMLGYSIPTVLVFLNKRKSQTKKYRFAFINYQGTLDGNNISYDEMGGISRFFEEFKARSDNEFVATLEDVQQNEYKLSPFYYLGGISAEIKKLVDTDLGKHLEDVCQIIRGNAHKPSQEADRVGIPFITIKDLAKDVIVPHLDLNDVILSSPGRFDEPLNRRCILVSLVGRDLKPTIYEPKEISSGILVGKNIAVVIPNEQVVDFEYLYYQFYSPLVMKQVEALLGGVGIPNISIKGLKSIVVSIPPLSIQRSLVSQQKSLLLQAENRRHQVALERLRGVDKKQEAEFSIVSHLTHGIRPKLLMVKSPIQSLIDFLKNKNLLEETLSTKLDGSKESVGEALDQAIKSIEQISDVLMSTRKLVTSEISRNDFRVIDIRSVLEDEILPIYLSKRFKILFHYKGNCVISLHRESFVEAINNLIVNAEVHAFKGETKNPEVSFDIHGTERDVIIDYTNNGLNFPDDMTEEQYLTFGEKSTDSPGDGLGGAWIGRFLDAHMGTFAIIRDKHPLHFKITLPRSYR